jgi:glycosyltransferase involved in cell wall biosynthesis
MKKIAVVYLARLHEGFAAFETFAEAYRRYPAGEQHDLYIICKGFKKPGEFAAISAIFTGIDHQRIAMDDDIGLDIHAYREAARRIDNEYICCLNTFTTMRTDNWLAKLWSNMAKPGVGMVGASGSFESLYSSYKVINFVSWAASVPARFDNTLARAFAWILNPVSRITVLATRSKYLRLRRMIGDTVSNRPPVSELQRQYPALWASLLSHDGGFCTNFRDFPHFPNPHLRSTAFMVRKADFLAVPLTDKGKIACCRFESGPDGISMRMLTRGQDILVVGADGVGYSMEQWPTCGAFRSGDQSNLLAIDNQTGAYGKFSEEEKTAHRIMTWGGYAPDIAPDVDLYGTSFGRETSLSERCLEFGPSPRAKHERLFSIAIPTHNRLDLVLDAIKTVSRQNYSNWEIVVFDNCSKEPVADAINALNDPRIRSARSEKFLPVTESWNNAINMAKGDFVTMVGDDDGIAPGYFERMNYLIERFDDADLIFTNLYQFMHPGVVPGKREGYVADLQMADFFADRDYPFVVDASTIRQSVNNSLHMRRSFMFNMPAFCCSKDLLDRMRIDGQVLHSPFPDYYFANLALEFARKVVAEPRPMAFQGVSKVSFGFTMMNAKIDDGFKTLNHDVGNDNIYADVAKHLLPGSRYNSEYIVTMAYLAQVLKDKSRQVDFDHYRKIQIWQYLQTQTSLFKWMRTEKGREIWTLLSNAEKSWAIKANTIRILAQRYPKYWATAAQRLARDASQYLFEVKQIQYRLGDHVTLADVFSDLENGAFVEPVAINSIALTLTDEIPVVKPLQELLTTE